MATRLDEALEELLKHYREMAALTGDERLVPDVVRLLQTFIISQRPQSTWTW